MLNYELVKKHFADKLAADFAGHGRFESAFFHTIKMVYDAAMAEADARHAERIAVLQSDIKTLCAALKTSGEGNAELLERVRVLQAGHDRYETVRRMDGRQWAETWRLQIAEGKPFDEIVDGMRPFVAAGNGQ